MRPFYKLYSPANESTTGIVNAATGATSPLTLAATSAGDSLAHQLGVSSTANIATIVFTITGTDADGVAQTETVTGVNNSTVETTGYFLTVSSVTISATLGANTANVGWVDEIATPSIPLNTYARGVSCNVDISGTINYTVQGTHSNIRTRADDGSFNWFDISDSIIDVIAITTDVQFGLFPIPSAIRLITSSYSSGATAKLIFVHTLDAG